MRRREIHTPNTPTVPPILTTVEKVLQLQCIVPGARQAGVTSTCLSATPTTASFAGCPGAVRKSTLIFRSPCDASGMT